MCSILHNDSIIIYDTRAQEEPCNPSIPPVVHEKH